MEITPGMSVAYQSILNDALIQLNLLTNISIHETQKSKWNIQKDKEPAKKIAKQRQLINQILTPTLKELQISNTFSTLTQWIDKERDLQDLLFNTVRREKEAITVLQFTQTQIAQEHKSTQKEIHEKESILQQLKDAIYEIRYLSTSEITFLKNEYLAKQGYNTSTREDTLKCLSKEINHTQHLISSEQEINTALIHFLTRQKESLESHVNTWSAKYESDLDLKTKELEDLKTARSQGAEEYEAMLVGFEKMERFIEEYKIGRVKLLEEMRVVFTKKIAAKRIQKWWRGYLRRKAALSGQKKGKKKGKK